MLSKLSSLCKESWGDGESLEQYVISAEDDEGLDRLLTNSLVLLILSSMRRLRLWRVA